MGEKDLTLVHYSPKTYDYRSFYSGEPELDEWLAKYAGQSEQTHANSDTPANWPGTRI